MDFFGAQDRAKTLTKRLLILFVIALFVFVSATAFVLTFAFTALTTSSTGTILFAWPIFWSCAGALVLIIFFGISVKSIQLRDGGRAIAEMLGGEKLSHTSATAVERILLNVVEEMAIAAGTPVPPVYILRREEAINAFAAGHSRLDLVIGITQGALTALNREELQGVIGHEFSHILRGDMALNMQLTKIIHGLACIYGLGRMLTHSSPLQRRNQTQALLGLTLVSAGSLGQFCGQLLKSAVSRQREFLADASAVQYTRNPQGISRALQKIGGANAIGGAYLSTNQAHQFSHAYFANGVYSRSSWLSAKLTTHPPLEQRIQRIDPRWNGTYIPVIQLKSTQNYQDTLGVALKPRQAYQADIELNAVAVSAGFAPLANQETTQSTNSDTSINTATSSASASPTNSAQAFKPQHQLPDEALRQAQALIHGLEPNLIQASHQPLSACALVCALLLHQSCDDQHRNELHTIQARLITSAFNEHLLVMTKQHAPLVAALHENQKFALLDQCLPTLAELSKAQFKKLSALINALIHTDQHVNLFEWLLEKLVTTTVSRQLGIVTTPNLWSRSKVMHQQLGKDLSLILSAMIHFYIPTAQQQSIFEKLCTQAKPLPLLFYAPANIKFQQVDHAIDHLAQVKQSEKPRILALAKAIVEFDNLREERELAFIRVLACVLDCPIPLGTTRGLVHSLVGPNGTA